MKGLITVLSAFIIPFMAICGVHCLEGATSAAHWRLDDQLTACQLWLKRLPVPSPSDQIVRLQVATFDWPRLILVHDRRSRVGYFIGKNITHQEVNNNYIHTHIIYIYIILYKCLVSIKKQVSFLKRWLSLLTASMTSFYNIFYMVQTTWLIGIWF